MDRIFIHGARFQLHIGVSGQEREHPREVIVDIELGVDTSKAAGEDDLAFTVCYDEVQRFAAEVLSRRRYHLLEALAGDLAGEILRRFEVEEVVLRVKKPSALPGRADCAGVETTRSRHD